MHPAALQLLLQSPYRRESWATLLPQLLPGLELFARPADFPLTSERECEIATARRQFGRATLADGKIVALYEIDVVPVGVDLLRNRVALRQLIARCIDQVSAHAVLAFFVQPGTPAYRLTYAARESTFDLETLALETRETATRRFTYVLGPGETRRTAALRLAALAGKRAAATLADVTDAFSVERLNAEFFDIYRTHYGRFCKHLLAGDAPVRVFGLALDGLKDKARDRALKPVRDFVKKLLGRLVFLHFLQKKGWLGCPALPPAQEALPQESVPWTGGQPDFLRELFRSAPVAEQDRFHSARLVPLFFDTLNDPRRPGHRYAVTGTRVPYLNGGLFERDFAGVERLDFPAALFGDLLDFFGQYHFTIDENDPEDHEIGIDPEMLGHIFENLLEDNKDKGAYYTPKAVVRYMARQSLIHALASRFPDDPAARREIEALIRRKEPIDTRQADAWLTRHATRLAEILDGLKICDPAIGSGAFPIGLLQEIYWTRLTLNPALDRAAAKRAIIGRSIHGVDLDAGAVEIARLRFWLALVVEEPAPVPLPNLDYQIMQGNSLLESFEGERLDTLAEPPRYGRTRFGSSETELDLGGASTVTAQPPAQRDLADLQRRYFACHEPETKARLRAGIDAAVLRAIDARLTLRREELETSLRARSASAGRTHIRGEDRKRAAMQAELDALSDKSERLRVLLSDPRKERPFFLWHLWFRHVLAAPPEGNGGFDIVIANPPYIGESGHKWLFDTLRSGTLGVHYRGKMDLFYFFFHLALEHLAKAAGEIAFITTSYFISADGAEHLRGRLKTSAAIQELLYFNEYKLFGGAKGQHSLLTFLRADPPDSLARTRRITTYKTGGPDDKVITAILDGFDPDTVYDIVPQSEVFLGPNNYVSLVSRTAGTHTSDQLGAVLAKLHSNATRLGDICEVNQGVVSGCDVATEKHLNTHHLSQDLLGEPIFVFSLQDPRHRAILDRWSDAEKRHCVPFYKNSEISQFHCASQARLRLLYLDRTVSSLADCPNIEAHLEKFRPLLSARREVLNGRIPWFQLQWPRKRSIFVPERIVVPYRAETPRFAKTKGDWFCRSDCYILVNDDLTYSNSFLLAVLNSPAVEFFLRRQGKAKGKMIELFPTPLNEIPIPATNETDRSTLASLVNDLIRAKENHELDIAGQLKTEIDTHVFRLYGLTPEEIQLVRDTQL